MKWINLPFVRRTRQHHAIEHATVNILTLRNPRRHLIARSDSGGFQIYGPVGTGELREAVQEALSRLQAGERELAVHPNCGTNIVTAGVLAGLAGVVMSGRRKRRWWEQIPLAFLATTLALLAAQPLGYLAQEQITTLADVHDVRLGTIRRHSWGTTVMH
ncbi:MAG: hypothetical protein J7M34_08975, partial [Anaerolineae bacterium]|nr:hypothetical protein [Anaerolineae bacterium]